MELDKLKSLLAIDKASLDDEVSKQPMLFFEVSEAYIEAMAERDACKEELASVDAGLDSKVRKKLEKASEKITEPMVKNAIQIDKEHQEAFDTYMEAKIKADKLSVLKEAFDQRRSMLSSMVQLHSTSYWQQSSFGDKVIYTQTRQKLADARSNREKVR